MSTVRETRHFKAPRWICTEAGQWAYESREAWRITANQTFGVTERRQLLDQAEQLRKDAETTPQS